MLDVGCFQLSDLTSQASVLKSQSSGQVHTCRPVFQHCRFPFDCQDSTTRNSIILENRSKGFAFHNFCASPQRTQSVINQPSQVTASIGVAAIARSPVSRSVFYFRLSTPLPSRPQAAPLASRRAGIHPSSCLAQRVLLSTLYCSTISAAGRGVVFGATSGPQSAPAGHRLAPPGQRLAPVGHRLDTWGQQQGHICRHLFPPPSAERY